MLFLREKALPRYFLHIQYAGTHYFGWQVQPQSVSVQEKLNGALSTILRIETSVTGAGRTDTGVHARQMYAHFDTSEGIDANSLTHKLNGLLPADISIKEVFEVQAEAHARFDAMSRTYEYWITRRKDPFLTDRAMTLNQELDVAAMNACEGELKANQDFTSFSKSNTQVKTNNCEVIKAHWVHQEDLLIFTITADRFLRNMVRAIVGTLLEVGQGKMTREEFRQVILDQSRSKAGVSVPASGLYLTRVEYPWDKIKLNSHG